MKSYLLVIFFLVCSGCTNDKSSKKYSEGRSLEEGYNLVDDGRFDEAITHFQAIHKSHPSDDSLKAWASVYVSRAGLKVATLYEAFNSLPRQNKVTRENIIPLVQTYQAALEKIPFVEGDARFDLETASSLLKTQATPSVRLFRAMVNLVLLRSYFSDGSWRLLDVQFKADPDENLSTICKLDWKKLRAWIQEWTTMGLEMKQDLDLAFPRKTTEWSEHAKFFTQARSLNTAVSKACQP